MAELRQTEEALRELCRVYHGIQTNERLHGQLPPLQHSLLLPPPPQQQEPQQPQQGQQESSSLSSGDNNTSSNGNHSHNNNNNDNTNTTSNAAPYTELNRAIRQAREQLVSLVPATRRFRTRLADTDPVTQAPRYGAQTQRRVQRVLACFEELGRILRVVEQPDGTEETNHNNSKSNHDDDDGNLFDNLFDTIASRAQHEHDQAQRQQQLAQQQAQAERDRRAQLARDQARAQQETERQAQLAAQRRADQERRQRHEAREAVRRERHAADRAWVASVPNKGTVDGVRRQLAALRDATHDDRAAQTVALAALRQLFRQICAHPERVEFRRIRRDHEQFHRDIGRWTGGAEVLMAAGFRPATLDDVPCWYCKEPNLEVDLDAWAAWFDLLKATLQLLEQETAAGGTR